MLSFHLYNAVDDVIVVLLGEAQLDLGSYILSTLAARNCFQIRIKSIIGYRGREIDTMDCLYITVALRPGTLIGPGIWVHGCLNRIWSSPLQLNSSTFLRELFGQTSTSIASSITLQIHLDAAVLSA